MIFLGLAALTLCPAARRLYPASWQYKVLEIEPHVFVWDPEDILELEGDPDFNRATNAGFIITPDGVVVVDTSSTPFHGREILYEIRRRSDAPVQYVINTDASPARTLGNEVFADLKPAILATAEAAAEMKTYRDSLPLRLDAEPLLGERMRGVHPTVATETFTGEKDLTVGGTVFKVIDLGRGVSAGDAAVYLPQSKVVFLGGLFENGFVPHIGSCDIHHWMDALKEVEGWDAEIYVPAHGEPGGKQEVEKFRQFLAWLTNSIQERIQKREPMQQIQNELVPFKNYPFHAAELEPEAVEAVYRELTGQPAPPTLSSPLLKP